MHERQTDMHYLAKIVMALVTGSVFPPPRPLLFYPLLPRSLMAQVCGGLTNCQPLQHAEIATTKFGNVGRPNDTNRLQPHRPCRTERALLPSINDSHGPQSLPDWQQHVEATNPPTQGVAACSPTSNPSNTGHTNKRLTEYNSSAVHRQQTP